MTRLTEDDLRQIPGALKAYDRRLKAVTGLGLLELALKTTDMTLEQHRLGAAALSRVAVVPISTGQGIIPGFSQKVADVGRFLGLPCQVTGSKDVAGLGAAIASGSDIIVLADDDAFLALNLNSRRVVDNASATGQIYAAALMATVGGAAGCLIGVLGLGGVGRAAAAWLLSRGAQLVVYDRDQKKQVDFLTEWPNVKGADSVGEVLKQTNLVVDATSSANIIKAKEVKDLVLTAPGIPLGIDDPNSDRIRLIHDPLQLGVAAMLVQALA